MRLLPLLLLLPTVGLADEDDTTHITVVTEVTATSTLKGKNPGTYAPTRVLDDSDVLHGMPPAGAWCEGKPDEGIGEGVTLHFSAPAKVSQIVVRAGFWKTEKLFRANNLVTAVEVTTDDGKKKRADIPAELEPVEIPLGGAPTQTLTVAIAKVKKGRMNDSCISGIEVKTDPESVLVVGMDPALAAAIPRVERALRSCDEKKLAEAITFPFSFAPLMNDEGTENEGKRVLHYATAAAMATACKNTDDRLVPRGRAPGVDAQDKKGVTFVTDGSCGNGCEQWGFVKKAGAWRFVWSGPVWIEPRP